MNTKQIFESYLSGRLQEQKLGSDQVTAQPDKLLSEDRLQPEKLGSVKVPAIQDTQRFTNLLQRQIQFNNYIIIVAIIGLLIIFAVDLYFIFYYRDEPKTIAFLFSGTLVSLIGVIRWLRRLWMDKTVFDVSLGVVQELPPVEAIKFIEVTYWRMINKK